jgi:ubiquinone/menaquinone biosynthesis C-methylase UbiE
VAQDLPDPVVPADAYDEAYYREWCMGFEEYNADPGAPIHGTYAYALQRAALAPGEVVVDIGTGRGELLALAMQQGAGRAVGLEYSEAAVALAHRTLEAHDSGGEVLLADARAIPLDDDVADLVTLLDVVEHLSPEELHQALCEARRILRPGGRILAHTFPNRLIYDVTYRLQRLAVPGRARRWPKEPRGELEAMMHVNEQTRRSLARALKASGFADVHVVHGEFIHDQIVPLADTRARTLVHRLAAHRPTRALGRADLWARGRA